MRGRVIILILIVVVVLVGGLSFGLHKQEQPLVRDPNKLQVVTTFAPLYIFTKNIVGDHAEVHNLLSRGVGPHDYSFTPSDVKTIAEADVLIKQGRHLDEWVDEVVAAAGSIDLAVIIAGEDIEPHTGSISLDINEGQISAAPEVPLVRPDPEDSHLWIDPFLAIKEVENIRDGLMRADPARATEYALGAEEYLLRLLALDQEVRSALNDLPKRDFVSFHPAFRYFAYEYGLREVAVIEKTPGEEPTPQGLIRIIEQVQESEAKVIFIEPQFSPKIAKILAQDYGLRLAELDPLETGELREDYYEEVTRKNVQTIIESFQTTLDN